MSLFFYVILFSSGLDIQNYMDGNKHFTDNFFNDHRLRFLNKVLNKRIEKLTLLV